MSCCKLLEFQKCWCCIPLEIGVKIIAVIQLILSFVLAIYSLVIRVHFVKRLPPVDWFIEESFLFELQDVGLTLQVVFGIYALVGLYEKKTAFLLSWIIYEMTAVFLAIILIIGSLIRGYIQSVIMDQNRFTLINPEQIVEECLFIVVFTHNIILIYSFYKKLDRHNNDNHGPVRWRIGSATVQ